MDKKTEMKLLAEKGLNYREIGEQLGVSRQYVAQCLGKVGAGYFRGLNKDECIYEGLRLWMTRNHVSRKELMRKMGLFPCTGNSNRVRALLSGKIELKKHHIDKLIGITGMNYEALFGEVNAFAQH